MYFFLIILIISLGLIQQKRYLYFQNYEIKSLYSFNELFLKKEEVKFLYSSEKLIICI